MRKSVFYETRNGFKATLSLNDLDDNLWIDIMLPKFLNQDDIVYKDSNVEITNSTHLGAFLISQAPQLPYESTVCQRILDIV